MERADSTYKTVKKKHAPRLQKTGSLKNERSIQTIVFRSVGLRRSEIMNHAAKRSAPSIAV